MRLEIRNISKAFCSIPVLEDVNLVVNAGEVHALLGENGAGKSTLLKILAGVYQPDTGSLVLDGAEIRSVNAHQALRHGIATVYQELMPFPELTVAENILMGQEPVKFWPGWVDKRRLRTEAARLLGELGFAIAPTRRMRELRVAEMQAVEIAKALAHNARVILFDEPTSALGERETEALFRIIRELKNRGVAIVYISHKLEEVFRIADRATVMRDGRVVATHLRNQMREDRLIAEMVGRDLVICSPVSTSIKSEPVLTVAGLSRNREFSQISFEVRAGEILGLAGLVGAGRTALLNALYGLEIADEGEIRVKGRLVRIRRVADALRAGIGLVTEDRRKFGFVPAFAARPNMTLSALRRCCRAGWIRRSHERRAGQELIRSFSIRGAHESQPVQRLSGGNQQKVVLARTLFAEPDILLLDEPTRGIDIGAKAEVHEIIRGLARAGKAVVLASSELPELLSLSHRLLVLREGKLVAEIKAAQATAEQILGLAMP